MKKEVEETKVTTIEMYSSLAGSCYSLAGMYIAGNKIEGRKWSCVHSTTVDPAMVIKALDSCSVGKAALAEYVRKAIQDGSTE